ncbi:tetratricopeptide repeat protein [Actinocrispum wychmicini]|uniref:tetratricopeptide repeat protein n=1 Tax=Actinocrispum wychmicini TaxID=1213861 RepID=UPI00140517A3|nr:tetratricopeptide repeat protein [Actinocrispum wychmicini]
MAGTFGAQLRQLRHQATLTQQQLAQQSGVSVRAISGFESGRRANPRVDTVRLLAQALGLEPDAREELLVAAAGTMTAVGPAGPVCPAAPVPRQTPGRPGVFVGRHDELAILDKAFDAAGPGGMVVVSAVGGGGIGKSWLALHWAHTHADRFPDGQLFVDLRGFAPQETPMPAAEATRVLLSSLGVAPAAIPADLAAQTALYRGLTTGKRMLILLDNARDTEHVTPLLPGGASCSVIVTSRDRLTGLVATHGATPLPLDVLDDDDARHLLARRLGDERLAAEPGAVTEILACCAGLPLALAIIAARAALHPDLPLAVIAADLRDTTSRLGALDANSPTASVQAALSGTHRTLDPDHARVFALLGAAPGPHISVPAAASLTDLPEHDTAQALRTLERVSLLQQPTPGRYRMHDLVKLFAAHHSRSEHDRDAALRRLVDFYLHTASAGREQLDPYRQPIQPGLPAPGCRPHPLTEPAAAQRWFDTEHPNLLAAQQLAAEHHWHHQVWQTAWTLNDFLWQQGHSHDFLAIWSTALTAAEHLTDPVAQSLAHRGLGRVRALLGQHDEGLDHLHRALALAQHADDPHGQGHTHRYLAWVCDRRGDHRQALRHLSAALGLFHTLDMPAREGDVLNMMGWSEALLGDYDKAREHCEAALALLIRHDFPLAVAATLDSLGYIARRTGRHADALDYYQRASTLCDGLGHTIFKAEILDGLGHAHLALGQHEQARTIWQQTVQLYHAQHRTHDTDRVNHQLATLTRD